MSAFEHSLRNHKALFQVALEDEFSSSEIQLMWRQVLSQFLGISTSDQILMGKENLSSDQVGVIEGVLKRILNQEPFQHIIGEVEFYGLELKIDGRALIPRPETEELVDWIVKDTQKPIQSILDVCSGSGCIALALSQCFDSAQVSGVEFSVEALALSEENAMALKLPVDFYRVDVLDAGVFQSFLKKQTKGEHLLDIVVANPPYIPLRENPDMDLVVTTHEPSIALFVPNDDPLLFYRKIANGIYPFLSTTGALYFECHYLHLENTREMLLELGFKSVEKRKDLQGKWRMLKAQK